MISEYIELNAAQEREQEYQAEARQYRIERAYNDAYGACMNGSAEAFWADTYQSIYDAVREAMAGGFDVDPSWFKATVSMAVCLEAEKYATAVSQDVD